jgi:hypothetical protein
MAVVRESEEVCLIVFFVVFSSNLVQLKGK